MMHVSQPVVDLLAQEITRARRRLDRALPIVEPAHVFRASAVETRDLGAVDVVLADLSDLARGTGAGGIETVDLFPSAFPGLDPFCRVET